MRARTGRRSSFGRRQPADRVIDGRLVSHNHPRLDPTPVGHTLSRLSYREWGAHSNLRRPSIEDAACARAVTRDRHARIPPVEGPPPALGTSTRIAAHPAVYHAVLHVYATAQHQCMGVSHVRANTLGHRGRPGAGSLPRETAWVRPRMEMASACAGSRGTSRHGHSVIPE